MDDLRFGGAIRAARLRRGWRQLDLAARANVSTGTVSRLERGRFDAMDLRLIRRVCSALEIGIELLPRSRAGDLERVANARHAALGELVVPWLQQFGSWEVRPEVSFSKWGERGIVDLVAWHPQARALLVIELKTELVDINELLGTFDRKHRLGRSIAADLGWSPSTVSSCLIVADSSTNRRRIEAHRALFEAAFQAGALELRRWLAAPAGELRALRFFPNGLPGSVRQPLTSTRRVRRPSRRPG